MGTFEGDFVFYMCHCSILTCMPGGGGGVILEQKSWIELDFLDVTCRLFYSHQCTLLKRQTEHYRMSITSELLKMPCLPVIWVMDMGAKILCSGTTEHLVNRSIKDDPSTGVGNKYLYA